MLGVDRFTEGTEQKPDVFYQLQNMYVPNPGEMASINGVTKLNGTAIPGVNKIIHSKFLDTSNEKGLVIFFEPTTVLPSAPSGFTFSTSGGAARDLYVEYISPGGGRIATQYAGAIQTNGVVVTIPAGIDTLVRSINFWVLDNNGYDYVWVGGAFRTSGLFPATITVYQPSSINVTTTNYTLWYPSAGPTFTPSYDANGLIQSDRTYFFGIGPWFGSNIWSKKVECSFYNSSTITATGGAPMSCYVPNGSNKIDFVFDFCPVGLIDSVTVPLTNDYTISRAMIYMGTTIEDMVPCGPAPGQGVPYAVSQISTTCDKTNVSAANDTLVIPGFNVPTGAILKYTTGTGSVTGLTNNGYYYVVNSVFDGSNSTVKLSVSFGGAVTDLTGTGGAGNNFTMNWGKVTGTVLSVPDSLEIIPSCGDFNSATLSLIPQAQQGRKSGYVSLGFGYTINKATPTTSTTTPYQIACASFSSLNVSSMRTIPQAFGQLAVNLKNYKTSTTGSSGTSAAQFLNTFLIPVKDDSNATISWLFQSRQYGNRLWVTNGYNEPFYTNGYVLKSGIPSPANGDTFARWPITALIEFYKDRMILASGTSNLTSQASGNQTYQAGWFYYSKITTGVPDIQNFCFNSTTPNAISVSTGDQSEILGLNVYSQDLTSVGAESFLVVGKEQVVLTWDGDLTHASKQISKSTGFAGPNCYALTKFGPVFVGSDNVYLFRSSQDVVPIGYPIKDIIKRLNKSQLRSIFTSYHDEDIKIGYSSGTLLDYEIWLRLRYNSGGVDRIWNGPHRMKEYSGTTNILNFDSQTNVRISYLDGNIYRRDDPGSFLNDGLSIPRVIKIKNLGLQQDHLLKLIKRFYLALRTVQDESFDISLESEDGSQSIVVTSTLQSSGNMRQMKQIFVPQRFLARVLSLTIENTSNGDLSIYDLSILFEVLKRRTLP